MDTLKAIAEAIGWTLLVLGLYYHWNIKPLPGANKPKKQDWLI